MATVVVTPKAFGAALRARIQADRRLMLQAALEAALWGEAQAVMKTDEMGVENEGHFKRSWKHVPTHDGAELVNDAPYAAVIEYGRRPGARPPPFGPILRWVELKLVQEGAVEPEEAEDVAWAIRQSIATKGIPPKRILGSLEKPIGRKFLIEALKRLR